MHDDDYFERLLLNVAGLNNRFPAGEEPFQILSRMCEEAGELAQAENHIEGTGIKVEKYGLPDSMQLAEEVHQVLRAALGVAVHYGVVEEVKRSIDRSNDLLRLDGYLHE